MVVLAAMARAAAACNTGPVGDRVREGQPQLDHVGAGRVDGLQQRRRVAVAAHRVAHQARCAPSARAFANASERRLTSAPRGSSPDPCRRAPRDSPRSGPPQLTEAAAPRPRARIRARRGSLRCAPASGTPAAPASSVAESIFERPWSSQVRELGPDAGIVEPRADRVRLGDLPVLRLQHVGARPMEHAGASPRQRRAMLSALEPVPRRLHAVERDGRLAHERGEARRSRSSPRRRRPPPRRAAALRPERSARAPRR